MAPGEPTAGSAGHLYAIGPKVRPRAAAAAPAATTAPPPSTGAVAQVQIFPYEALLDPGAKQPFILKLYDDKGNLIRTAPASEAQWTLDLLGGSVGADGVYVAPSDGSAGFVKAAVGGVTGQARVRVIPPLPWTLDFEGMKAAPMWWTSNLKGVPNTVDGSGVLIRPRDETVGRRTRFLMDGPSGPTTPSKPTCAAPRCGVSAETSDSSISAIHSSCSATASTSRFIRGRPSNR
jgi:hypothetical protein